VYFLRGGLLEWTEDVMNPVLGGSAADLRAAALSRYFGGVPRARGARSAPVADEAPRDTRAAVAALRRRGC
jgi:hypothetical protein